MWPSWSLWDGRPNPGRHLRAPTPAAQFVTGHATVLLIAAARQTPASRPSSRHADGFSAGTRQQQGMRQGQPVPATRARWHIGCAGLLRGRLHSHPRTPRSNAPRIRSADEALIRTPPRLVQRPRACRAQPAAPRARAEAGGDTASRLSVCGATGQATARVAAPHSSPREHLTAPRHPATSRVE